MTITHCARASSIFSKTMHCNPRSAGRIDGADIVGHIRKCSWLSFRGIISWWMSGAQENMKQRSIRSIGFFDLTLTYRLSNLECIGPRDGSLFPDLVV